MGKSLIQQGVGVLIHFQKDDLFYVQRKDHLYPDSRYVGAYAFWGGAVESYDHSYDQALTRELVEELNVESKIIHGWSFRQFEVFQVRHEYISYDLHLYYLSLNEHDFMHVSGQTVNEGEGVVKNGMELVNSKWIWDTSFIFRSVYEKI